jgi:hypothetical protein
MLKTARWFRHDDRLTLRECILLEICGAIRHVLFVCKYSVMLEPVVEGIAIGRMFDLRGDEVAWEVGGRLDQIWSSFDGWFLRSLVISVTVASGVSFQPVVWPVWSLDSSPRLLRQIPGLEFAFHRVAWSLA